MSLSGTAISYDSTKIQIEESDEGISISYFGDNLSGTVSLVICFVILNCSRNHSWNPRQGRQFLKP